MRLGAINWDSSRPATYYYGGYSIRSLSPSKYRGQTPFYAEIVNPEQIAYHMRSQEEYDKELSYAIESGLDYLAYCWLGEDHFDRNAPYKEGWVPEKLLCNAEYTWEHTYARSMYAKSALNKKLKMCAIVLGAHPYSDKDLRMLALEMQQDYYEKINGRPLVYIWYGYLDVLIEKIRRFCDEVGTPQPYVAFMMNSKAEEGKDYGAADCVSAYAVGASNITTHAELCTKALDMCEDKESYHMDIIPTFTVGWDPSPRIDHKIPWGSYGENVTYAKTPTGEELTAAAERFADWIKKNEVYVPARHILTFAWNEFEEGAWICPTYSETEEADTTRLYDFRKAAEILKNAL